MEAGEDPNAPKKKRKKAATARKTAEKKKAPMKAATKKPKTTQQEASSDSEDSELDADLLSAVAKGEAGVGWKVKVNWPKMNQWYEGTVLSYDAKTRQHKVSYTADKQVKLEPLDSVGPDMVKWLMGPNGEEPTDEGDKAERGKDEEGEPETFTEREEEGGARVAGRVVREAVEGEAHAP